MASSFASQSLLDLSSLLAQLSNETEASLLSSSQCYVAINGTGSGRRLLQSSFYYTLYLLPPDSLSTAQALVEFLSTMAYTGPRSSLVLPSQEVTVRVACDYSTDVAVGEACPALSSTDTSTSSSSVSDGEIAGAVIAALFVVLAGAVAAYCVLVRYKRRTPTLASSTPALHIAINSANNPYDYGNGTPSASADIHLTSNNIHLTSGNSILTPNKIYLTPTPPAPPNTYALPQGRGARAGRTARPMAVADFLMSLSIPTPSMAQSDSEDGDSDSEHIGGWRGGNSEVGGGAVFVLDAATEADLFSNETVEVADEISVVEPSPDVMVYVHD